MIAGMRRLLLLVCTVAAACAHSAANPIGAGSLGRGGGHAWLVVDSLDNTEEPTYLLLHAPPRGAGADVGALSTARRLASRPASVAAIGDRVYLLFKDASSERIVSIRAIPSPIGEEWMFDPPDRLDPVAVSPAGVSADELVGAGGSLWLLGEDERDGTALFESTGGDWNRVDLPPDLPPDLQRNLTLVALGDGPALLGVDRLWSYPKPAGDAVRAWETRAIGDISSSFAEIGFDAQIITAQREGETLALSAITSDGTFPLASIEGVQGPASIAPSAGSGQRVVVVWKAPPEDGASRGSYVVTEVSAATGEILYQGEPRQTLPLSVREFRLLAVALVGLMIVVLLVVLRPDPPDGGLVLPDYTALADPSRRFLATIIDLLIAALLVGTIMDVRVLDIISLSVLIMSGSQWVALPATLAAGAVIGTVCEAAFGRTAGKAFTGCRVVPIGPGEVRRLPIGRCAVRNLIKWLLPPVPALAGGDPDFRHRADVFARAVVVIELEPSDGAPAEDEEQTG